MQYSEEQLFQAVTAIVPEFATPLRNGGMFMPMACRYAAAECFINQIPEDDNVRLLRQALQDEHNLGYFNYGQ